MVRKSIASCAFLLGFAVLDCSSSVPQPPYVAQPAGALVEVDYPPPLARVEFVPPQPKSGAVWVRGEWEWQGRRWGWKPGVWVVPPQSASYAAWTTTRSDAGQLYYAPGTWRGADGGELASPPALQQAKAHSAAVINIEGEVEPTGMDSEHAGAVDGGSAGTAPDGESAPSLTGND